MPIPMGMRETRKSGIMVFHEISLAANWSGEPFLKNHEDILPFAKAQRWP